MLALNNSFITKLVAAETKLEVLEIAAVEGLKITASSTAAKGSITVKWTVKGDTSAADGSETRIFSVFCVECFCFFLQFL